MKMVAFRPNGDDPQELPPLMQLVLALPPPVWPRPLSTRTSQTCVELVGRLSPKQCAAVSSAWSPIRTPVHVAKPLPFHGWTRTTYGSELGFPSATLSMSLDGAAGSAAGATGFTAVAS